jgi:hypothetical protein
LGQIASPSEFDRPAIVDVVPYPSVNWRKDPMMLRMQNLLRRTAPVRALVAGWFSFQDGHATAGDVLARDLLCEWLREAGYPYDIAGAPPFDGDVNLRTARPEAYSHAFFVCGPFERKTLEAEFLGRYAKSWVIGVNLTMVTPLDAWNPFDLLLERDSSAIARPDLVFGTRQPGVPVVGICLVEPYPGAIDAIANAAIDALVASREMSVVRIDTRLDSNSTGLRTPAEVESLISRMDVVVTTRLHGMVFSLKNGVPVIAIDPEAGGAKIVRQGETIGWPHVFAADAVTAGALAEAFDDCLTEAARDAARACAERSAGRVDQTRLELLESLRGLRTATPKAGERQAFAAALRKKR